MRYPGGKGKCYQHIINVFPPHSIYIETHLGGGAVLRHKKPAATSIGVDRDAAVIQSWERLFPLLASYVEADAVDFLTSQHLGGDELVYPARTGVALQSLRQSGEHRCCRQILPSRNRGLPATR